MNKHTPGPWKVKFHLSDSNTHAEITPDGPGTCGGFFEEHYLCVSGIVSEADGFLIAAAPDLLDALGELLYARTDKAERMAREAIAKATGEKK